MKTFRNFRKILFFFSIALSAQSPAPTHVQIKDFSPNIKSISIGPYSTTVERCNLFFNSPAPGQIQIVCYAAAGLNAGLIQNQIVYNSIQTPTGRQAVSGTFSFGDGTVTWLIYVGNFQLVGAGTDNIEAKENGTF